MGENAGEPTLKIGAMARRFGLNVRTLRYYEELGLLPAAGRTESGYRVYSEADAERLRFVLQAKQVGFTLEEIRRIVELGQRGSACGYVRETLREHIAAIDAQLAALWRQRQELGATAIAWQQRDAVPGQLCGLIEQSGGTPRINEEEEPMTIQKRKVEVFTAGCPVCEPAVQLVQRVACPSCDVTIYNVKDDAQAAQRAKAANISRLPMVLVDGQPLECCQIGPVAEAALRAAGVGTP